MQPIMPAILDKTQDAIDNSWRVAKTDNLESLILHSQSVQDLQKQIDQQIKSKFKKKALVWSEIKEPKGKIALKAFEEI